MKTLTVAIICSMGASAFASPLPSALPDGKYAFSCQSISVKKYDAKTDGDSNPAPAIRGTDGNGITRKAILWSGTNLTISSGDTTTIKEVYSQRDEDNKMTFDIQDVSQSTVKSLGNNQFEETVTGTSQSVTKFDSDTKSETASDPYSWKRTLSVQDNFEVNITSKNGSDPELPGRGENYTSKNSDGSITVTSYNRENYHQDRKDHGNGSYSLGGLIYQTISICNYVPTK